jgi:hypothetical protein
MTSENNGKKPANMDLGDRLEMMDASGAGISQVNLLGSILSDYLTSSLDGAPDVKLSRSFNPKDAIIGQLHSALQGLKQTVHGGEVDSDRLLDILKKLFNSLLETVFGKTHSEFFPDPEADLQQVAEILERFAATYGVADEFNEHVRGVIVLQSSSSGRDSGKVPVRTRTLQFGADAVPVKESSPPIKIMDSLPPPPGEYREMVDSLLPPEARIDKSEKERAANQEFMTAFDELFYDGNFDFPQGKALSKTDFDRQLAFIVEAVYQTVELSVINIQQAKEEGRRVTPEEDKYPNFRRVYEHERFGEVIAQEQAGGAKEVLMANLEAHVRKRLETRARRVLPDILDLMESWVKSDPESVTKDNADIARELVCRYYHNMAETGITSATPDLYKYGLYFYYEGLTPYLKSPADLRENSISAVFFEAILKRVKKCNTGTTLAGIPAAQQPPEHQQLYAEHAGAKNGVPTGAGSDAEEPELDVHGYADTLYVESGTDTEPPTSLATLGDAFSQHPAFRQLAEQIASSPTSLEDADDAEYDNVFSALIDDAAHSAAPDQFPDALKGTSVESAEPTPEEIESAETLSDADVLAGSVPPPADYDDSGERTVVDEKLPSFEDVPDPEAPLSTRPVITIPDSIIDSIGRVSHPEVRAGESEYTEEDDEPTEIYIPSSPPPANDGDRITEVEIPSSVHPLQRRSTLKNLAAPPAREGEHGRKGAGKVVVRQSSPPRRTSSIPPAPAAMRPHVPVSVPPSSRRSGSFSRTLPFGSSSETAPEKPDAALQAGTLVMESGAPEVPAPEETAKETAQGTVVITAPGQKAEEDDPMSQRIEEMINSGQDMSSLLDAGRGSRSSLYGLRDFAATKSMMDEAPPGSMRPEDLQQQPPEPPKKESGKVKYVVAGAAALGLAAAIYGVTRPDTATDTTEQPVASFADAGPKTEKGKKADSEEQAAGEQDETSGDSTDTISKETTLEKTFAKHELSSVGKEVVQRMRNSGLDNKNGIGAWIFTHFMGSNAKPEQIQAMYKLMEEFNRASYYDAIVTYLAYSQKEINEILYDRSHPQHRELVYLVRTIGHPYKWVNPENGRIFSWNEHDRQQAVAEIERKHAQSLEMFKNFKEAVSFARLRQGLNISYTGGMAVQQLSIHDSYVGERFAMVKITKSQEGARLLENAQIFHLLDEIRSGDLTVAAKLKENSYKLASAPKGSDNSKHGFNSPVHESPDLGAPAIDLNNIFGSPNTEFAYLPGKDFFVGLTDEECGIDTLPAVERHDYLTELYTNIAEAEAELEKAKNSAVNPIDVVLDDEDILDITDMDPDDPRIAAHAEGIPWIELDDEDVVEIAELDDEDIVDITDMNEQEREAVAARMEGRDNIDLDIEALEARIKISAITQDRRGALLNRGEVLVPNTLDGQPGSVKLAFLNGLIRECSNTEQQNAIESHCERELKLGNLIEEVLADDNGRGYTYGKVNDIFMKNALEILGRSPDNEIPSAVTLQGNPEKIASNVKSEIDKTLEDIDAGWEIAA